MRSRQRLAAYALIVDDVGRVLLARQPDGRRQAGRWSLPGGGIEHGEHPRRAVIREVREETGLQAQVGELREILSDVVVAPRRRRSLHTVRLVYLATIVAGEPAGQARWCTSAQWQALPLAPFTAAVLGSGPR